MKSATARTNSSGTTVTNRSSSSSSIASTTSNTNNNHNSSSFVDYHKATTTSKTANMSIVTYLCTILTDHWKGGYDFVKAQVSVCVVLFIARFFNNWEPSYPRNDNHNMTMFWSMNAAILLAGVMTLKHDPNASARGVQLLSRSQTEEWKGMMQWAFIMYHYYRAYPVYNLIRVFVSAYVWMTGFGNFLYFDKKQDFSITRACSMWLRINYFPILLSYVCGVPFDLFYIVPLHTTAFFITMVTCFAATKMPSSDANKRNVMAVSLCVLVHVIFYETPCVEVLKVFSDEIYFRFQADKYSAALGIVSGYFWGGFKKFIQTAHMPTSSLTNDSEHASDSDDSAAPTYTTEQRRMQIGQRICGVVLIVAWYVLFGYIEDKYVYNPIHPYIFWIPIAGWLMVRNSSKYLCEIHSTALEFFGKITLETYVLQFMVFMNHNVQHIPVILPGSGADGVFIVKFANMALCGTGFVALAYWARQITVTTQTTVTDLVILIRDGPPSSDGAPDDEKVPIVQLTPTKKSANNDADGGDKV